MTETTEYREYNVPEESEENWHEPVNENWQAIDSDVQQLYEMVDELEGDSS